MLQEFIESIWKEFWAKLQVCRAYSPNIYCAWTSLEVAENWSGGVKVSTAFRYLFRVSSMLGSGNFGGWNKKLDKKVYMWLLVWFLGFKFIYRVSHSKVGKVILLWWGYRFWFLLIFWFLCVHEIEAFMPSSSVFIFLMLSAL